MTEPDPIDRVLRESMGHHAIPALSPQFEGRLNRRLRPRRMSAAGRLLLAGYAVAALVLSVAVMRADSVGTLVIAAAVAIAAVIALAGVAAFRPSRRRAIP